MRWFIASSSGRSDSREPGADARLPQADVRPSGDHAHSYETGRHVLALGWSASVRTLQPGPDRTQTASAADRFVGDHEIIRGAK